MVDLSKTNIDFDSINDELKANLQNRDTFKALFPGETGNVLTEQGAGLAALQLFHIHSSVQNAFFGTAFDKAAVYALAATLGNPPTRKLGAQLTLSVAVNSTLTSSLTLPKFSRFSGRGVEWYTIEDLVINPGDTTVTLQVRQGERITENFTANGKNNQRIEIGEDFNIDENFLTVKVDTTEYTKNGFSLLNSTLGATVYAEQTNSNGRVIILFGNTVQGTVPALNANIEISYANTVGLDSNSSVTNDTFQFLDSISIGGGLFLQLTGTSTTTASGGSNEESISQVKNTAPRLFAANQRAVRRDDYVGHILSFTGANAAKAFGEFEEGQQKGFQSLEMMNRAYVTAIANTITQVNNVFGTGNGVDLLFFTNLGLTNLFPGSVSVNPDVGALFADTDGRGILLSDDVSFDEITGAGASSTNVAFTGAPANAFDGNSSTAFTTSVAPTVFNPVRVTYDLPTAFQIRSVRIRSTEDPQLENRAFPKQIKILASNLAAPDPAVATDWEVIRGVTLLDEPGFSSFSKWIPVDDATNTTNYEHFAIEILDRFGSTASVSIADIQVQSSANTSIVNYETGAVELRYTSAPSGNLTANAFNGNFSATQKSDLLTFLADLNHFTTQLEFRDPKAFLVDVVATVRHLEGVDAQTVLGNVQTAIDNLFTVQSDSISKPLYLSDVYQAIQDVDGVDYTTLDSPTTDLTFEIDEFALLNSKTISVIPTDR